MNKIRCLIFVILLIWSPFLMAAELLDMLGEPISFEEMMNMWPSNHVSVCARSVITPAKTNLTRLTVKEYVVNRKEDECFPFDNPIMRYYTRRCGSDKDEILSEIEVYWQDGKKLYLETCATIGIEPLLFSNAVHSASNQIWEGINNNEVWVNISSKKYTSLAVSFKYHNGERYSARVLCKKYHMSFSGEATRALSVECKNLDLSWLKLGCSQEFNFNYDTNLTAVASKTHIEFMKQKGIGIKDKCKRDQIVFQNMSTAGIQFAKDVIVYQQPQSSQRGYYSNSDKSVRVSTRRYNSPIDYEVISLLSG